VEFKADWDEAKLRLAAWWRGEIIGRVALQVRAPRAQPLRPADPPPMPQDPVERWTSADYRIGLAEHRFAGRWYGGEAFPYFDTHLGPGSLALYLGSEPAFSEDTVWYQPSIEDPDCAPVIEPDPQNRWWLASKRLIEEGVRRGDGRYLTSLPDLIENLDTLASLRGTKALLMDLMDRPEWIHRAQREVQEAYFECFDALYAMASGRDGGSCFSAFDVWAPGRMAKLQCDLSAMISRRMFEEFVLPYLWEQCERLDCAVYHLDGPDAIQHLDALLSIPGLTALQWTPGAGQPGTGAEEWFGMYRRARRAGKSLLLMGVETKRVRRLVEELGPEGLLIGTRTESQEEGEALLEEAERWR